MNKKVLVSAFGILGIIVATIGITYAFFSYSRVGTTPSTIRSGAINFSYKEGTRKIELDEVMPMTDFQGKNQSNYFDFEISAKTSRTVDIPYDITVRKATGENILSDSIIKVYLTRVSLDSNENEVEDEILLTNVSNLNGYTNNKLNIPATEKLLYTSSVKAGDTNYTQKYRLRMWIDESANYLNQTSGIDSYPLQGKTYSLTVNVYGEGLDIGESGVATRQNTNISSISFTDSEDNFTLENGVYTSEAVMPEGETTMTKTITVETENPNATVTYQKVDEFGAVIPETGIKRLSTSLQLPLEIGTNNFIITVKGEDGRTTNEFNLSITVNSAVAQPVSFSTDSWETIQKAVQDNNTSLYNVGDTRTIELGNDLGTHKLRLANKTACTTETSTTGCGFVIEFADIISEQQMNTTSTSVGGYPASAMYSYVTETVYNALPSELKAVMQDTTVVSSHGSNTSNPNNSEIDANNNFITRNQKIYLLDRQEVLGDNSSYNTAASTTRQLDYYSANNTNSARIKKYQGSNFPWWLRSASSNYDSSFNIVYSNGSGDGYNAYYSCWVSPAFRIG